MKTKTPSITFKNHPKNTGLYSVGNPDSDIDIKVDKKKIGLILASSWQQKYWRIQIAIKKPVPDNNPNCDWKWTGFKKQFGESKDAKEFVKKYLLQFLENYKYTPHYFDDIE